MIYTKRYMIIYSIYTIFTFSISIQVFASDCASKLNAASWMLDVAECMQILQAENNEMKERIKNLENEIKNSRSKRTFTPRSIQMKMEARDFTFDLHKCGLSGQTMKCSFEVINTGKDRRFQINNHTQAYDDLGEPHELTQATGRGLNRGQRSTLTGIPMPLHLTFAGFPRETSYIPRLVLKGNFGTLTFRDVPITE